MAESTVETDQNHIIQKIRFPKNITIDDGAGSLFLILLITNLLS